MLITIIAWLFFCYLVGKFAQHKGHEFWTFALISAIISPIGGFIIALIVRSKNVHYPTNLPPANDTGSESIFCPNCGTKIMGGSAFCPNCGTKIE